MEGSRNVLFEYSLNIAAEHSLNIPFERSWNVLQEHSENIALERSKNPDIFLVLGTFRWNLPNIPLERSGKVLCYGGVRKHIHSTLPYTTSSGPRTFLYTTAQGEPVYPLPLYNIQQLQRVRSLLSERGEGCFHTHWIHCALFRLMHIIFHSNSFENLIWCNCRAKEWKWRGMTFPSYRGAANGRIRERGVQPYIQHNVTIQYLFRSKS